MKRGGALPRRTPLARTGRLSPVSAKRTAQASEYLAALRIVRRRDCGRCVAGRWAGMVTAPFPTECHGPIDPHHVWPVGRGGPRCDPENIILLCRAHHDWAHGHPLLARAVGLLGP